LALSRKNKITDKNYHLWQKQRVLVLRRDCYTCHYCGNPGANEVDHVIARVNGGGDEMDNLVACCRLCNLKKGKKEQAVFLGGNFTPPVFTRVLHTKTESLPLVGPFEGQRQPLWN
jgi:5-methylcytosine-specific restriction endonuclease McrA